MTEKKKVRGLLDAIGLEDGEWELEMPSVDYVPGMGLGATKQATRWAARGYNPSFELVIEKNRAQRQRGRPTKAPELKKPQLLALHVWLEVRDMPISFRRESNRVLLNWMCERFGGTKPTNATEKLWSFRPERLEKSLSTGRSFWGLSEVWESQKCEDFWASITENL